MLFHDLLVFFKGCLVFCTFRKIACMAFFFFARFAPAGRHPPKEFSYGLQLPFLECFTSVV